MLKKQSEIVRILLERGKGALSAGEFEDGKAYAVTCDYVTDDGGRRFLSKRGNFTFDTLLAHLLITMIGLLLINDYSPLTTHGTHVQIPFSES
jgi:hypothetical protein